MTAGIFIDCMSMSGLNCIIFWLRLAECLYAQLCLLQVSSNLHMISGCMYMHLSPYEHFGKNLHGSDGWKYGHESLSLLQFGK